MGFMSLASGEGDLAEKWLRGKMWPGSEGAVRVRQ